MVSLTLAIILYFLFSILFIILGVILIAFSKQVILAEVQYDTICPVG